MKQLLIDSLVNNDTIETEELNERTEKVDKPEDAANMKYEEILLTKRKGIISVAYHQGKCLAAFVKRKIYEVHQQVQNPHEHKFLQK